MSNDIYLTTTPQYQLSQNKYYTILKTSAFDNNGLFGQMVT